MMFSSLKEDEVTKAITARNFIPALKSEAMGITGISLRWDFVFGVRAKRALSRD
jgi:hypothetical protein